MAPLFAKEYALSEDPRKQSVIKVQHRSIEVLDAYSRHLKKLTPEDRYTRFCYHVKDEQIDQLILRILYNQQDHHLFIATEWDNIVGFGHMAKENSDWEVAVSVDSAYQGRRIGDSLMGYMIPWAKIHGVHNVFMHCITQNQKIQHLARKHGLRTVERDGAETTSRVELPVPTPMEYTNEFLKEQRELYQQIQILQQRMVKNLNPFVFVSDHKIDQ